MSWFCHEEVGSKNGGSGMNVSARGPTVWLLVCGAGACVFPQAASPASARAASTQCTSEPREVERMGILTQERRQPSDSVPGDR